jgi:hypothetical protein
MRGARSGALLAGSLLCALAARAGADPVYAASADRFDQTREPAPRPDGYYHVDTPTLMARLARLHATTYAFLLWRSPSDFADLESEFLPAAERAGLEVWAYLVPPSERNLYPNTLPPCERDYVCWGDRLGALAAAHPSLTTLLLDDFNANTAVFTPAYVQSMVTAARARSPSIAFYPVDYYPAALTDFSQPGYRGFIDGVVFPYINLDTTVSLTMDLDAVCAAVRAQLDARCFLLVFAGWTSWHAADPTLAYLKTALQLGQDAISAGESDGVITYRLDEADGGARFDEVAALYGAWRAPDAGIADAAAPADGARVVAPASGCAIGARAGEPRDRASFVLALFGWATLLGLSLARRRLRRR